MKRIEELKNLRDMDEEKLHTELLDVETKLAGLNLKVRAGKLDNFSQIGKTKKTLARINSIINEKAGE